MFSRTITTTYTTYKIKRKGTYKCDCGKKFTRTISDFYTMSPFNKMTHSENRKKCEEYVEKHIQEQKCPNCENIVKVHSVGCWDC